MPEVRLKVEVTLLGPILTRKTSAGEFGVDASFACDWRDGNLCFPGSLVKGKIGESWRQLEGALADFPTADEIDAWLGAKTGNSEDLDDQSSSYEPARGRAIFGESFNWTEKRDREETRQRIRNSIDDRRGAAEDAMLLVEEDAFASGKAATFRGEVSFWAEDEGEAARFRTALDLGLRAIPALGGNQGVGYGRIQSATVERLTNVGSAGVAWPTSGNRISVRWKTEQAICVSDHRPIGNIFRSEEIVPGGVFKGALATQAERLGTCPKLREHLSRIRMRHARPTPEGGVPATVAPLSLAVVGKEALVHDVVLQSEASLIDGEAPVFAPDWKDKHRNAVERLTMQFSLDRSLRVRTAIDPKRRRALDENLFAYDMVLPRSGGCPVEWVSEIDIGAVPQPDRAAVLTELRQALEDGIVGIGKTKARFEVVTATEAAQKLFGLGETVAITLLTDCLLGSPREMHTKGELFVYYKKCWSDLSGGSLELSHYFATQRLAGGVYHHRRFLNGGIYRPWMLTEARSVFVLKVRDQETASKKIQAWLHGGVELTPDVVKGYELPADPWERWKKCPYVPENGYGEIAVNVHEQWRDKCL